MNNTEKLISNEFEKIFQNFSVKNIKINKIVTIEDYKNKKYQIPISDYLWYFYQSLKINSDSFHGKEFISLNEYMYYDLMEHIDKDKFLWVKNNCTGKTTIQFEDIDTKIIYNYKFQSIIKENNFSETFVNFCEDFTNRILNLNCEIITTFVDLQIKGKIDGHASVIFASKENDKLKLFCYDSNGINSEYSYHMNIFLENLKNCILTQKKFIEIEILKQEFFGIQTVTDFDSPGYCVMYSLFFTFCFFKILYVLQKNNYKMTLKFLIENIENYFLLFTQVKGENDFFECILSFSNKLKDGYLIFLENKIGSQRYNFFLKKLNFNILEQTKFNNKNINSNYIESSTFLNNSNYIGIQRNYDEELKEYLESGIIAKYENENCKQNKECVSNICKNNKCTRPTPNDKLDFLTKLEWKNYL